MASRLEAVLAPLHQTLPALLDTYVDFHRNPELSNQEIRTAGIVAERLRGAGYDVTTGVGGTGVVALLRNGAGPTVAVRADMDALPVHEQTGLPYASEVVATDGAGREVGVAHACGHDVHSTCLIGAADLLARTREEWSGTLMLIAQPAEEILAGARTMLEDGLYERFGRPAIVLGQHVTSVPAGMIVHRAGPVMAAALGLDVTIHGRGGHGSRPDMTVDPVVVAAFIVTRLQTVVSREIDPMQPVVVTVGEIHAGSASNVIPDRARLTINVRSFDADVEQRVIDAIERIVRAEADAAGCPDPPDIARTYGAPVMSNDAAIVDRVRTAHRAWFGAQRVEDMPQPAMATEDFGLFAHVDGALTSTADVPTVFWFWGGVPVEQFAAAPGQTLTEKFASLPGNHHPAFMVDPAPTVRTGVEALVVAALSYLES